MNATEKKELPEEISFGLGEWRYQNGKARQAERDADRILHELGELSGFKVGDTLRLVGSDATGEVVEVTLDPGLTLEHDRPIYYIRYRPLTRKGEPKRGRYGRVQTQVVTYIPDAIHPQIVKVSAQQA